MSELRKQLGEPAIKLTDLTLREMVEMAIRHADVGNTVEIALSGGRILSEADIRYLATKWGIEGVGKTQ